MSTYTVEQLKFVADINPKTDCWNWRGPVNKGGYGLLFTDGHTYRVHRFIDSIVHGPIPEGICVCHHCDNPRCYNPAHLFRGTMKDNSDDKVAKGRQRGAKYGSNNVNGKLTDEQVNAIRALAATGNISNCAIARQFGLHHRSVWNIVNNRRRVQTTLRPL